MEQRCLKPKFENFPIELTSKKRWAGFKMEKDKNGKLSKMPYNLNTGNRAKSNDPQTWVDFNTARQAYEQGVYDGLVFAPTKNDKLILWDFDDCWTDMGVTAEIAPLIQELNTYTELSPSGTGLRAVANSAYGLPPNGRKNGKIEVYDSGQFLSITGHIIPNAPNKIETRTDEIKKIHRQIWEKKQPADDKVQKLLNRAFNSRQGDKIRRLFQGEYDHASQSEADLALCSHLAFYSNNDFVAIDKVFRLSKLMRNKWDEKHHSDGRTYGTATIQKAIEGNREFQEERKAIQAESSNTEKTKKPRGRTLQQLKQEYEYGKEIKFVWRKHLPKGMPVILGGREGHGKTSNALQMGKEILETHETGMVIWLATEGAVLDTIDKMDSLGIDDERFVIAQRSDRSFKWEFSVNKDLKELDALLESYDEPILAVFIDSIRGMSKFGDNDDAVGKVMHQINAVVCDKHRAALVYLDHHKKGITTNKLDKNVGTTAKTSAVRIVYAIEKKSKLTASIESTKTNIFYEIPELTSIKQGNKIHISAKETLNDKTQTDKAELWLADFFSHNSERFARDVFKAGEKAGFKSGVIKKAKKNLGCIEVDRVEGNGPWIWRWELEK